MRWLVRLAVALLLWVVIAVATTTRGPRVINEDCYRQAKWDGKKFIYTGKWVCLN